MEDAIGVIVRIRPEGNNLSSSPLSFSGTTVSIQREAKKTSAEYTFDAVLGPESTQEDLYATCSEKILGALEGVNTCIMAYGQTGSGKTFSMLGKGWESVDLEMDNREMSLDNDVDTENVAGDNSNVQPNVNEDSSYGVVPRAIAALYDILKSKEDANHSFNHSINCTFMQIYNEKIYDLLQDKKRQNPLVIKESVRGSSSTSVHVPGVSEYKVFCISDVMMLIKRGLQNRAIRCTEFNAESSRSHTILQLFIQVEECDENGVAVIKKSVLSLVDLAGSEKWRPSLSESGGVNVDQYEHEQKQLTIQKEMTNINNSLTVLGTCVSALLETGRKHIPYRNSSLTRLLQDSLGGNGRTIFIAAVQEGEEHVEETYSTLQFASRASRVKTSIQPLVMVGNIGNMDQARKEIQDLRMRLSRFQGGVSNDGKFLSSSQADDSGRIAELTQRIATLEQENASLRKLVDPLLLSKIKSLVNVNDDEPASVNAARLPVRASMEGNQSLRRARGDKLQPSPASVRDPNIAKRKLHLAKEKKIRKSIAALNKSLSPNPSASPNSKSKKVNKMLLTSRKENINSLLAAGYAAHEAEFALNQRRDNVNMAKTALDRGKSCAAALGENVDHQHDQQRRNDVYIIDGQGTNKIDGCDVFHKEGSIKDANGYVVDADSESSSFDIAQNITSTLRSSIEASPPNFIKSPTQLNLDGQFDVESADAIVSEEKEAKIVSIGDAESIKENMEAQGRRESIKHASDTTQSEPLFEAITYLSPLGEKSDKRRRGLDAKNLEETNDDGKLFDDFNSLEKIDVSRYTSIQLASTVAVPTKSADDLDAEDAVDRLSSVNKENLGVAADFRSSSASSKSMEKREGRKGFDSPIGASRFEIDVDDIDPATAGAKSRVVETAVSPLTNSLASTPAGSASVDSMRALINKAREGADKTLAIDAEDGNKNSQPKSTVDMFCPEVRESRSALPSAQVDRGLDSPARSLQRHSAGHIKSSPPPDPGKYINEHGISNIYAPKDTRRERLNLLNLAMGESDDDGYKIIGDTYANYRDEEGTEGLEGKVDAQSPAPDVSTAAVSYIAPSPISSARFDGVVGKCERHNLEKCVLCSLFDPKESTGATTSNHATQSSSGVVDMQRRAPSYFDPNIACQAHALQNCLLCRMKAEDEAGALACNSNVSQYIQPKQMNQSVSTSFTSVNKHLSDPVFDSRGLSDSEYIKQSVGRESLMKFDKARQQYEKALMRGTERRSVDSKVQPDTYGNIKYDDEENEREVYERYDLGIMNRSSTENLRSNWNRDEERVENIVEFDKYLEATSAVVDGNSTVIYEDDNYTSIEIPAEESRAHDSLTGESEFHDIEFENDDSGAAHSAPVRKYGSRRQTNNSKIEHERNHKKSLPTLNCGKKTTREVRFNVKSDTISAYAPPPERKKKVTRKLTKAPRLNDPSVAAVGIKTNSTLIAKREARKVQRCTAKEERKV